MINLLDEILRYKDDAIGTRLFMALARNGINTAEQFYSITDEEYSTMKGVGPSLCKRISDMRHWCDVSLIPGVDDEYLEDLLGPEKARRLAKAVRDGKTIIITGPQGPTGKTTLWDTLRKAGYPVIEKWNTYEISLRKFVR